MINHTPGRIFPVRTFATCPVCGEDIRSAYEEERGIHIRCETREPYDPWKVWTWPRDERDAYTRRLYAFLADVEDPGEQNEPPYCSEHNRYLCPCQNSELPTLYQPQYRESPEELFKDYGNATTDKVSAYRAHQQAAHKYGSENVCMVFYVDGYKHP